MTYSVHMIIDVIMLINFQTLFADFDFQLNVFEKWFLSDCN